MLLQMVLPQKLGPLREKEKQPESSMFADIKSSRYSRRVPSAQHIFCWCVFMPVLVDLKLN